MILIFGGAYQGKLAYAQERFGADKKIINGIHHEILTWIQAGEDVSKKINELINNNSDAVITCDDISCGVVPVCPTLRKWREEVGRSMGLLTRFSDEVIRLYCGIPTRIK